MNEEYILPQVAAEVATAIDKALHSVQSINGVKPDENGNVEITILDSVMSGQQCVTAYVKDGKPILLLVPKNDTTVHPINTSEENLSDNDLYFWNHKFPMGGQDGAFAYDLLFKFTEYGIVRITDTKTGEVKQEMELDNKDVLLPHANSVSARSGTPVRCSLPMLFESGVYESTSGKPSANDARKRTQLFNLDYFENVSISCATKRIIIVCYAEDGTYLGQLNKDFSGLIKGSGQWLPRGTVVTEETILGASEDVKQIAIMVEVIDPTDEPIIDATYDKTPVWLYANVYNTYDGQTDEHIGECCVYEVDYNGIEYSNTLVQVVKIGFTDNTDYWTPLNSARPFGNFLVDTENGKLIVYASEHNATNGTHWNMFDLPGVTDGEENGAYPCKVFTLTINDVLSHWKTETLMYQQGGCCHNGYAWCCYGYGVEANPAGMAVVNLSTHQEVARFDLYGDGLTAEPQFVDFVDGRMYFGNNDGMYEITLY